jgi:hypothetical protein
MDTKEARITCPCCSSLLEIDVRTEKVVRWRRKGETEEARDASSREEDWSSAAGRVAGRLGSAAEKFDASLSRERDREKDLDQLFRKASEKLERKGED